MVSGVIEGQVESILQTELQQKQACILKIEEAIKSLEGKIKDNKLQVIVAFFDSLRTSLRSEASLLDLLKRNKSTIDRLEADMQRYEADQLKMASNLLEIFHPKWRGGMWFDDKLKKPIRDELVAFLKLLEESKRQNEARFLAARRSAA